MSDPSLYIAYAPVYCHPLPEGHRFPMLKYELIPGQLLHEGTITEQALHAPQPVSDEIIRLTHTNTYIQQLKQGDLTAREQRVIGFPYSPLLIEREWIITQGTIDAALAALKTGVALNVAGGTHHAFPDHGEGFCLLNDQAVAANYLLRQKLANRMLMVDLDVHQGNGTAHIFQSDDRVFTFSMHGKHNYPFHKEKSDLDIELSDGISDEDYLSLLKSTLPDLIRRQQPDVIFFQAGVDILETDRFGKLNISIAGCKERDRFVIQTGKDAGIPVVISMGGGYSTDIRIIVEAHCNTFRLAKEIHSLP